MKLERVFRGVHKATWDHLGVYIRLHKALLRAIQGYTGSFNGLNTAMQGLSRTM